MRVLNFVCTAFAVLAMATVANAQFFEMGDAGDFPTGSFQGDLTGTAFTSIVGDNTGGDIDSYLIHVTDPSMFAIADVDGAGVDNLAFLWTPGGAPVASNDDVPGGGPAGAFQFGFGDAVTHSTVGDGTGFVDPSAAGFTTSVGDMYILSVAQFGATANDAAGGSVFAPAGAFTDLVGPSGAGPFAAYAPGGGGGAYTISLSGAEIRQIPEPAATGIIAMGLVGLVLRRRK